MMHSRSCVLFPLQCRPGLAQALAVLSIGSAACQSELYAHAMCGCVMVACVGIPYCLIGLTTLGCAIVMYA